MMSKIGFYPKYHNFFSIFAFFPLTSCWPIFNDKGDLNGSFNSVRRSCVSQFPKESEYCYEIIDCLMENSEPAITLRWSAGASILAFIPTILVLMSNSLDEIINVAEDSPILAILLCLSSVTPFSSRFGFKLIESPKCHRECQGKRAQRLWDDIEDRLYGNGSSTGTAKWWQVGHFRAFGLYVLLLGLTIVVWYYIVDVMRYGVVVFACKIKSNVVIWAAASQSLGILNVLCRRILYDTKRIDCPRQSSTPNTTNEIKSEITRIFLAATDLHPSTRLKVRTSLTRDNFTNVVIILRSPRKTNIRWTLQITTAVLSYGLFAYGTIVFASMTLYVASDAIRVLFAVTISAGIGRFVVSLLGSTSINGIRMVMMDIPFEDLDNLSQTIQETVYGLV